MELTGDKLKTYNGILRDFQKISEKFYGEDGFIAKPESYTGEKQEEVYESLSDLGCHICQLFEDEDPRMKERRPIRDWLSKILYSSDADTDFRPVTIVTNDLNVPWFWLKKVKFGPFLCEKCPLGLLQLSAGSGIEIPEYPKTDTYNALLIDGATTLPFASASLDAISGFLGDPLYKLKRFQPHRVTGLDEIRNLRKTYRKEQLLSDFRIIHFSGQYDRETMLLNGESVDWDDLSNLNLLSSSLLVLDGASRVAGFGAWTDAQSLTSALLNQQQALGCVVNVLPVKDDPIVSQILWGNFYRELRQPAGTIAQALFKARKKLREHFEEIGSKNPPWAFYHLLENPSVHLHHKKN